MDIDWSPAARNRWLSFASIGHQQSQSAISN